MSYGSRETSLVVNFDKLTEAGRILGVQPRGLGGAISPAAVIEAALDAVINSDAAARALEIVGNPVLVDLEAGRNGWR